MKNYKKLRKNSHKNCKKLTFGVSGMPKYFDKSVVQHSFCASVGGVGFSVTRECDNRGFRIPLVANLDVDNFPEFREVIVQVGYVVQTGWHFFQFQRAIRGVLHPGTEAIKIERSLFEAVLILIAVGQLSRINARILLVLFVVHHRDGDELSLHVGLLHK